MASVPKKKSNPEISGDTEPYIQPRPPPNSDFSLFKVDLENSNEDVNST